MTVTANTPYTLSAYVNGAYVYLGVSGTGTSDTSTWTPGTGGSYAPLSIGFKTGACTTRSRLPARLVRPGQFYADDVSLPGSGGSSGGGTPTPTPTPTSTPTPTPTPAPPSTEVCRRT